MTRGRAGPHRRRLHVRARQGRGPRGRRTDGHPARVGRCGTGSPGRVRPRAPDAGAAAPASAAAPTTRRLTNEAAGLTIDASGGSIHLAGAVDGHRQHLSPSTAESCRSSPTTARPRRDPCPCKTRCSPPALTPHVVATHKGAIAGAGRRGDELTVDRSFHTASSAEADGIIVAARHRVGRQPGCAHVRAERLPPLQADRRLGRRSRAPDASRRRYGRSRRRRAPTKATKSFARTSSPRSPCTALGRRAGMRPDRAADRPNSATRHRRLTRRSRRQEGLTCRTESS